MNGSPAQVRAAATALTTAGTTVISASEGITALDVETWHGSAADGFRDRRLALSQETTEHAVDLRAAANILKRYASEMETCDLEIATAKAAVEKAWDAWRADPLDLSVLPKIINGMNDASVATDKREQYSIHAADELLALVASDESHLPELTWPPDGWPPPASLPTVPIPGGLDENSPFDPLDVSQGGIGDCYLLASLMALMQTDEGDQLLRDNLRWDPERGGYWVTLHVDGKEVVYFVDRAQQGGATENGGPGIASIYENALKQHLKFNDLNDGGWPADALELLTGGDTHVYEDRFLRGWDWGDIRNDVEDGDQLVAATRSGPKAGMWPVEAERPGPDGSMQTVKVDIVGSHAYTVVSVEKDGDVVLMNPWGEGNGADGGGPIRISQDDFERIFHQIASTGDGK